MTYIGHKARIPPKSRLHEWKSLEDEFPRRLAAKEMNLRPDRRFGVKALETQIRNLEECPPDPVRAKAISKLKLRLTRHMAEIHRL